MKPHAFASADGSEYDVIDFRVVNGKKRATALCDPKSEGRAFVPRGAGETRVYLYGAFAYRSLDPKLLAQDFRLAKPVSTTAAARSWGA